jgi:hypothetical protein
MMTIYASPSSQFASPSVTRSVSFSSKRRGFTFVLVPYSLVERSQEAQACLKPTQKSYKNKRYVGFPWFLNEGSRSGSKPIFSPNALVCSMFGVGSPGGKLDVSHVVPSGFYEDQGGCEKSLAERIRLRLTRRSKHREQTVTPKPLLGFLLAGCRDPQLSRDVNERIANVFASSNIPLTRLALQSETGRTNLLTLPKLGQGTVFVGLQDTARPLLASADYAAGLAMIRKPFSLVQWWRRRDPVPALPGENISPVNWRTWLEKIDIRPGDRVFVGPEQVWPERSKRC